MQQRTQLGLQTEVMKKRIKSAEILSGVSMVVAFVLLFFYFLQSLFLLQMVPFVEVVGQPFSLVTSSKDYINFEPVKGQLHSLEQINEGLVRFFVTTYHTSFPDLEELTRRWKPGGDLWVFSSPKVYYDFNRRYFVNVQSIAAQNAAVVDVDIQKVKRLGSNWQVEFNLRRFSAGSTVPEITPVIASLTVLNLPENVRWGRYVSNPVGMTVTEYQVTTRRTGGL